MKGQRTIIASLAVSLLIGAIVCFKGHLNSSTYSGPLTGMSQLVGTQVHTPPDRQVATIVVTEDGKMTTEGLVGWGADGRGFFNFGL